MLFFSDIMLSNINEKNSINWLYSHSPDSANVIATLILHSD